ncbi:hypothetical protein FB451DRAFT_1396013 [Mycena latifolia]|nr:hypothetical protein FB451DRAFT_1396013 [Mycena latifolia]
MFASVLFAAALAPTANAHRITPRAAKMNDCFGGIAFGEAGCSMTEWNFDAPDIGGLTWPWVPPPSQPRTRPPPCAPLSEHDVNNIQGFSATHQIRPDTGWLYRYVPRRKLRLHPGENRLPSSMVCSELDVQGYLSGTCGGTGPVDQATRTRYTGVQVKQLTNGFI